MAGERKSEPRVLRPADLPRARAGASPGAISTAALPGLDRWTKGDGRTIDLPRVGALRLSFAGIASDEWRVELDDADEVGFAFDSAGDDGTIAVARGLAAWIVAAVLRTEAAESILARPLGRAERGVLAAVLGEVLRLLGSPWRLSLASPPAAPAPDRTTLIVRVDGAGAPSTVAVAVPRALLATALPGDEVTSSSSAALPVLAVLELGRTSLIAREAITLDAGDAVVFEGVAALAPAADWPARLRVGPHAALVSVDPAGSVRLRGGFHRLPIASGQILRKKEDAMDDSHDSNAPAAVEATQLLAAAPVEIVAELGRLSVRGDEVLSLVRGGVLSFGGLRATAIALRVGDEIWARGELVDIDGELGVRITELCDAHPARGRERERPLSDR